MCVGAVNNLPALGSVCVESPQMPGWGSGEALCVIPLGQVIPVRNMQTADISAVAGSQCDCVVHCSEESFKGKGTWRSWMLDASL